MENLKVISGFFTEKGNVSVKVRNALKTEALKSFYKNLNIAYANVVLGKDNAYYVPIGKSKDAIIYARLELTISIKEPTDE
jgi:hypothetical protein